MPRVYSKRKGAAPAPKGAVYVGRPSPWGNPFIVGVHGEQGECVELYRRWIVAEEQGSLRQAVRGLLRGQDLVCWCAPEPCHADVLLEIANGD